MNSDSTSRPRRRRGRPASPTESPSERRGPGATRTRLMAARILERVLRVRAFANIALHHALARSTLSVADRALATQLVYGTLRWRGRIDYLLTQVVDRKLETLEPMVVSNLRLGAYQILFCDNIPTATAVDQAVHCTRALGPEKASGLVNASLRRLGREHARIPLPELDKDPLGHLVHALSIPQWVAEGWIDLYGPEQAAALAEISNQPPPLTVRPNRLRTSSDTLLEELRERFPEAMRCLYASDGLILGRQGDAGREPAFLDGRFTVQDEGSQLVVDLLDPQPGEAILDTCAAPGTKTTAIAERMQDSGTVLAIDKHTGRLGLVARATRRLGLESIRTLARDATLSLDDLLEGSISLPNGAFDRILVDAPCTGLGTLRRHPDARWRIQPEDCHELQTLQLALLERSATVLRPGGVLVYSTCTLRPDENENLVQRFLKQNPNFRMVSTETLPATLAPVLDPEGFLRCLPQIHDTDGFFAARMERT
jgi:16S rRNA (cytosine967-C5)-methyltransferase